jgi:hypothetical protein
MIVYTKIYLTFSWTIQLKMDGTILDDRVLNVQVLQSRVYKKISVKVN